MGTEKSRIIHIVAGWDNVEALKARLTQAGHTVNREEWYAAVVCHNTGCAHRIDLGDKHPYCSCIEFLHEFQLSMGPEDTRTLIERSLCNHASNKRSEQGYLVQPNIPPPEMQ